MMSFKHHQSKSNDDQTLLEINHWVAAFCAGDRDAFTRIHDHFKDRLWKYICGRANNIEDAEDLFNIVSLTVARSLPRLKEADKLNAWVISIANNRISDYYQKKQPTSVNIEDFVEVFPDGDDAGETRLIKSQRVIQIRGCIRKLPQPGRTWFEMQFLAEVPQVDIARHFDVNLNRLKARIARSKVKVADCLRRTGLAPGQ